MCNDCESKAEYDRYGNELDEFLDCTLTRQDLSIECINSIKALKKNLKSKEYKLAGYNRHFVKNCMDAMTTSAVEGNNRVVKHGCFSINARMNIDSATRRLLRGINMRLQKRIKMARREVCDFQILLYFVTICIDVSYLIQYDMLDSQKQLCVISPNKESYHHKSTGYH